VLTKNTLRLSFRDNHSDHTPTSSTATTTTTTLDHFITYNRSRVNVVVVAVVVVVVVVLQQMFAEVMSLSPLLDDDLIANRWRRPRSKRIP